jgi:aryl-alcohol dehydrogenase-like predicted oxidoreductase
MRSVLLGPEPPPVSAIGFGAWGLSGDYGAADDAESIATIQRALDLGVELVDTADEYGEGHNERLVGDAIHGRREEVFLATKAGLVRGRAGSLSICARPDYLKRALEASLRRLRVESVDLFYLHRTDPSTPIEESVGAMSELVSAGKARNIGLCEVGDEIVRRAHSVHPLAAIQSEYSLWTRDPEERVLPVLRELGIGFVAFSPLGRGILTGTLRSRSVFEAGDFRRALPRFQRENLRRNVLLLEPLIELAAEKEATPAQVALAWLVHRGVVPIPGTRRIAHLEENVGSLAIELTSVEQARLDSAFRADSAEGSRYPPSMRALDTDERTTSPCWSRTPRHAEDTVLR